jgi:hypothetical protein
LWFEAWFEVDYMVNGTMWQEYPCLAWLKTSTNSKYTSGITPPWSLAFFAIFLPSVNIIACRIYRDGIPKNEERIMLEALSLAIS